MKRLVTAAAICVLFASSPSIADAAEFGVSVKFSQDEIRIVNAWYNDHRSQNNGNPGKRGRNTLPPGIAKNLERGKPLPPGIAKQYLPEGLRHNLPAPPRGYERIIVDGKILLIEIATQVIHDILTDVILS